MPTAPPSRCTDPECGNLATHRGRCDDHQPIPWAGRDDKAGRYGISSGRFRTLKRLADRRDNGCCYMCGLDRNELDLDDPDVRDHELDHIIPISEGGSVESLDNLGLACTSCHETKSKAEAARANRARRRPR
ncbi:HNH endonuclease [Streptomyces sp. NPDC012950]|uniref:HNH endonuclease n=1 Tax=Streptomyces sp. NPDC012950 TaxID=3364858 RepID=UPI0036B31B32